MNKMFIVMTIINVITLFIIIHTLSMVKTIEDIVSINMKNIQKNLNMIEKNIEDIKSNSERISRNEERINRHD